MQLIQAFEDQEVRQLLMGEEGDLEAAFTQVDTHLRRRFVKGARERLPGLHPEDLADAWQETLKDLLHAVRSGRFDPNRELGPWLWTIFLRRAFDTVRRRESYASMMDRAREHRRGANIGGLLDQLGEEEREELLGRVRQAIDELPDRQRTVLQVFVAHFPMTQDKDVLRERVSEITGREETPDAIRRALWEARRKVSDELKTQPV